VTGPHFLDASICIYMLKGMHLRIAERMRLVAPKNIRIAAIVRAELRFGARKSRSSARTLGLLDRFLAPYEVVAFDSLASDFYADLRFDLERKGTPIGANDMVLAATVLARHGCVVTHNTEEFRRARRLRVEDWTG
jgi:tRNA(fMet)-specific endonuclease VapC